MQVIKEFSIQPTSVVCPACNSIFATPGLVTMPNVTPDTLIEADLHRVLPDAAIRAALVAMCPACSYTWWITAFRPHLFKPGLVPPTPIIDSPKKFAHAVLTGRQNGAHSLDLALLALNGCWCAREAGQPHERWLELAGGELEKALRDVQWNGNRSYYHYVMGEVCRQSGDFKGAVNQFNLVGPESMLPKELVERQKVQSISGDSKPAALPPHLVELLFCPKMKSQESLVAEE
jgi:hypothetical protein